jgi:hypothetical protein
MKNNLQSTQAGGFPSIKFQFIGDKQHHYSYCEQLQAGSISNSDSGDHALSVSTSEPHQAQR